MLPFITIRAALLADRRIGQVPGQMHAMQIQLFSVALLLLIAIPSTAADLRSGLLAHWTFDDVSKDGVADGSGNEMHGEWRGFDKNPQVEGVVGKAVEFDGKDDGSGEVTLVFGGGGAIRLEVECLDVVLDDLGLTWVTTKKPQHEVFDE